MGGRYLVSGVQLGMLKAFVQEEYPEDALKLINTIIENQFLGDSEDEIQNDIDILSVCMLDP